MFVSRTACALNQCVFSRRMDVLIRQNFGRCIQSWPNEHLLNILFNLIGVRPDAMRREFASGSVLLSLRTCSGIRNVDKRQILAYICRKNILIAGPWNFGNLSRNSGTSAFAKCSRRIRPRLKTELNQRPSETFP